MRKLIFLLALLWLGGCEKLMRDMYDQPRYKPLAASPLFPDGSSARPDVPGTVPTASKSEAPPARTLALFKRGRERFDIYCAPCHSPVGDGDGIVARRGFPRPPSYHIDRLREAPDRHLYDVITQGYGVMHSYAASVPPEDRWAIVAYIRALQLSQHARREDLR
jgi:mono/diheme cytochrome c family protein